MKYFPLSDLVMLQMLGGLSKFTQCLKDGGDVGELLERTRAQATTPGLFREIVSTTISTQFSDPATCGRELAQNARDSYPFATVPKRILCTTKEKEGGVLRFSVRDKGVGMNIGEVIQNLLVPYNSGKEFDPTKIGEHGIGWFSSLDIAKQVHMYTKKKDEPRVVLHVTQGESDWQVGIALDDEEYVGTGVHLDVEGTTTERIESALLWNLGLADPETIDLQLNQRKCNNEAERYTLSGEAILHNQGLDGVLRLHYSRHEEARGNLCMTQGGWYFRTYSDPFPSDSLHAEMFKRLGEEGMKFWVDLPANVGLTKGRNNVVAQDRAGVDQALRESFEQTLLHKLLDDRELVGRLDHCIADIVALAFRSTEASATSRVVRALKEAYDASTGLIFRPKAAPQLVGPTTETLITTGPPRPRLWQRLQEWWLTRRHSVQIGEDRAGKERPVELVDYFHHLPARKRSQAERAVTLARLEYRSRVKGFSREVLEKRFIPAWIKPPEDPGYHTRVSVGDMVAAYHLKSLYLVYDMEGLGFRPEPGIYVNQESEITGTVMDLLRPNLPVIEAEVARTRPITRTRNRRNAWYREEAALMEEPKLKRDPLDLPRVGRPVLATHVRHTGQGREYLTLLDLATEIDGYISEANSIKKNPLALHSRRRNPLDGMDIAHTNYYGISLNLQSLPLGRYLAAITTREFGTAELDSLVEVLLHEKAHCVVGLYGIHEEHGPHFYKTVKRGLRRDLLAFMERQSVDLLQQAKIRVSTQPSYEPQPLIELAQALHSSARLYVNVLEGVERIDRARKWYFF